MQLTSTQTFPADPTAVHAMVTDEAFLNHAASELGATSARVEATPQRTRVEAVVEAPGELRSFLGASLTVVQETAWSDAAPDGSRDGQVRITVPGTPASLEGAARLRPTASGSEITYDGTFTVKVPFLGPTIEKQAAPLIVETLEIQERVGRSWLTR